MISARLLLALFGITFMLSCKKTPMPVTPPRLPGYQMDTVNLGDKVIRAQQPGITVDLNQDGVKDLIFGTMLVGDPVHVQDKMLMMVTSDFETNLPVNQMEEVPVFSKGDTVPVENLKGHHWYNASSVTLVRKVTGVTGPSSWEGNWKSATAKFLPVQVLKNGQKFNGWVQLTVDIPNERIVLHQAAISKVSNKAIVIL